MQDEQATYVALSPHHWGKGTTAAEAKRELTKAGGDLTRYTVTLMPPGATEVYVDDWGTICWTWAEGTDRDARPTAVESRGI